MVDNRNIRNDRIDVRFSDERFKETLLNWKKCCGVLDGGQTARLQELIVDDLKKIKPMVASKLGLGKI